MHLSLRGVSNGRDNMQWNAMFAAAAFPMRATLFRGRTAMWEKSPMLDPTNGRSDMILRYD